MGVESYRVLCLPFVLDDLVSFSNMLLQLFFKLTCLGDGDMDFLFLTSSIGCVIQYWLLASLGISPGHCPSLIVLRTNG